MNIEYRDLKEFEAEQLKDLFLSVDWESGNYPEKLQTAMRNSHKVCSAWDGGKLIGLMNCLSDGIMSAYFPYLLVNPEYQGNGIGTKLIKLMLEQYKVCFRKTLIAYDHAVEFYKKCGFEAGDGKKPMGITNSGM